MVASSLREVEVNEAKKARGCSGKMICIRSVWIMSERDDAGAWDMGG